MFRCHNGMGESNLDRMMYAFIRTSTRRKHIYKKHTRLCLKLQCVGLKKRMQKCIWFQFTKYSFAIVQYRTRGNVVSNHRRLAYLLSRLFKRRSKKTSKLRLTSLCEEKPSVTGGFHFMTSLQWYNIVCRHASSFYCSFFIIYSLSL